MTRIIDGKAFAASLCEQISDAVYRLTSHHDIVPGLAVVLVGDDVASGVYVRNKKKKTESVGMNSFSHHLPTTTPQDELLELIDILNHDDAVHGILVQLPLPEHIDEQAVINAIDPAKDVDGFHVVNSGKLATGQTDAFVSCTPLGCLMLIRDVLGDDLSGQHAVIIGRSNIVGKPMAQLLLGESCTVTICHSKTKDIQSITSQADILVAAVGRTQMVGPDWVKDGAVVIDVGINRNEEGKLVGDVDFDAVKDKVKAITPVPGGVGPMTIACLLRNTLQAACQANDIAFSL